MPQADIVADPHVQQRGMIETVVGASHQTLCAV
jgi:hypothetical protein